MKAIAGGLAASLFATAALAATPPAKPAPAPAPAKPAAPLAICAQLSNSILQAEYALADNEAGGIGDDSAPRATMRAAESTAKLAEIQANLMLMSAHRCAPYPYPISSRTFFLPALQCDTAILDKVRKGDRSEGLPEACDRTKWTRPTSP